jgi:hypothetical protein
MDSRNDKPVNVPRRTTIAWSVVAVIGTLGIFAPGILGIDGFDGGFALSVLSGFVGIVGITAAVIYGKLARVVGGMLNAENLLAHWKYAPEEWRRYTEAERIEEGAAKRGVFMMISIIAVIVGVGFWLVVRDSAMIILVTIAGIVALVGITAWATTEVNYRRNRRFLGEAYITRDGVYLNRQIHIWKGIGTKLESASWEEKGRPQPVLYFRYSSVSRTGRDYHDARVPVPKGKEESAKKVLDAILSAHLPGGTA